MNYSRMLSDIEDYISKLEDKVEDLEEKLEVASSTIKELEGIVDHLGN